MKPFLLKDAVKAIGGRYVGDEAALERVVESVTSDSRNAGPGALFIAFRGSRVDGHSFIKGCLEGGAVCCVSEREPVPEETPCIVVESSLNAIGALAAWHRSRFDIPVIGVTGSVGKTTTKEMLAAVLSVRYNTHRTEKNFNNELGVPWTLLKMEEAHEVSVVEMGISGFGEMRRLTQMVRPNIAVFSVIGDSHLEFLGDRAGVMRAKGEIFEGMPSDGLAVLNGDDEYLRACRPNLRRITYGCGADNDVRAEDVHIQGTDGIEMTVRHSGGSFPVSIPAFGRHMVYCALAAATVGLELGLNGEEIARGVADYRTVGNRARIIRTADRTIVSDCYNANPNSCKAALDSLAGLEGRKVCILGDMLELGEETLSMHRGVGEHAARLGIDLVIGCGALAKAICEGAERAGGKAVYYEEKPALLEHLEELLLPGDCVLVKASHSMAFEEIVERMLAERNP